MNMSAKVTTFAFVSIIAGLGCAVEPEVAEDSATVSSFPFLDSFNRFPTAPMTVSVAGP